MDGEGGVYEASGDGDIFDMFNETQLCYLEDSQIAEFIRILGMTQRYCAPCQYGQAAMAILAASLTSHKFIYFKMDYFTVGKDVGKSRYYLYRELGPYIKHGLITAVEDPDPDSDPDSDNNTTKSRSNSRRKIYQLLDWENLVKKVESVSKVYKTASEKYRFEMNAASRKRSKKAYIAKKQKIGNDDERKHHSKPLKRRRKATSRQRKK